MTKWYIPLNMAMRFFFNLNKEAWKRKRERAPKEIMKITHTHIYEVEYYQEKLIHKQDNKLQHTHVMTKIKFLTMHLLNHFGKPKFRSNILVFVYQEEDLERDHKLKQYQVSYDDSLFSQNRLYGPHFKIQYPAKFLIIL